MEDRSELSFQPVSLHGARKPAPRAQSHPCLLLTVRQRANRQRRAARPPPSSVHGVERAGQLQAGMSCQRPLRRRRLSVLRPPRELIRWRNPCVRLRLRFDLLRRCFFTIQLGWSFTLYEAWPEKIKEEIFG